MSRRKKDPLRELTDDEHQELTRFSRSHAARAAEVVRTKFLLAVARGDDYQDAACSVGRRSGDAVSHLVARFNSDYLDVLGDLIEMPSRTWSPASMPRASTP